MRSYGKGGTEMSRIGRAPITIPAGVEIKVDEHNHITVKGPKGTLERDLVPQMKVEVNAGVLTVSRPDDTKENRSLRRPYCPPKFW